MKYTTEQIVTILRHCGNQGDACPCIDCLLKDDPQGDTCMEMYNVAADEIEKLQSENIKLKELLKEATWYIRQSPPMCFECKYMNVKEANCYYPVMCKDRKYFVWRYADEIEEVLKDEV